MSIGPAADEPAPEPARGSRVRRGAPSPWSAVPLRVVIAPDSFKGSLDARQVAAAIALGLKDALGARVRSELLPMADGGEGTLDALLSAEDSIERSVLTTDALGRPRRARWGLLAGGVALIETAEAIGLPLVQDAPLRAVEADSAGVAALIADALDSGAASILLTVGGSATTDGGAGLLRGLGVRFLDAEGDDLPEGGGALARLDRLDLDGLDPRARRVAWRIACDVDTPLTGPNGAAAVFGPQKGASADEVAVLDAGLRRLAAVLESTTGVAVAGMAGAGAAGGIPAALHAILGARLVPGAELVADALGLESAIGRADLVVTGEGALDEQSLRGKAPAVVAAIARRAGVPVVVIAGAVRLSGAELEAAGFDAALSIADGAASLESLVDRAPELLRDAARRVGGLLDLGGALGGPR